MTEENTQQLAVDIYSDAFNRDPFPSYRKMRVEDPIYRVTTVTGDSAWLITRYEDAVDVLRDQRFIKDPATLMDTEDGDWVMAHSMLFSDPPDHKRLRALVQQGFTPKKIAGLRGRITEITYELLDAMQGKETVDFIDDLAFPLPIIVICELLGVPPEDRDKFRAWSNALVEDTNNPDSYGDSVQDQLKAFSDYIKNWIANRRKDPKNDLISDLIYAEENGDHFSEEELYSMVFLMIVAGHETTVNLIGNGTLALLEHPDQLDQLKQNPELIHTAIEEMLRYNGPVEYSTDRWASETLTLKGKTIEKGDLVLVALDSADRDPEKFVDPEVFDITREKSKHLAFGRGMHFCLGSPLARLEAEIAFTALFKRFPNLQLAVAPEQLEWRPGMLMRGVRALPVKL